MLIGRRGFLEILFGATAAALAPSLPVGAEAWPIEVEEMLVTPEWVTREVAARFAASIRGVSQFSRTYDAEFRMGDTVKVRLPEAVAC